MASKAQNSGKSTPEPTVWLEGERVQWFIYGAEFVGTIVRRIGGPANLYEVDLRETKRCRKQIDKVSGEILREYHPKQETEDGQTSDKMEG